MFEWQNRMINFGGYHTSYNQDLSFNIPLGYYLQGVESFHDSTSNDSDQCINGTRFHQGYRRYRVLNTSFFVIFRYSALIYNHFKTNDEHLEYICYLQ